MLLENAVKGVSKAGEVVEESACQNCWTTLPQMQKLAMTTPKKMKSPKAASQTQKLGMLMPKIQIFDLCQTKEILAVHQLHPLLEFDLSLRKLVQLVAASRKNLQTGLALTLEMC